MYVCYARIFSKYKIFVITISLCIFNVTEHLTEINAILYLEANIITIVKFCKMNLFKVKMQI